MPMLLLHILVLGSWIMTMLGGAFPVTNQDSPQESPIPVTFTSTSCPDDAPQTRAVECGLITLPRNYAQPDDGRTVILPVMRILARQQPSTEAPLYLLQGGPGGDTIDTFQYYIETYPDNFPTNRDIVFFEARGNRGATPSLECSEFADLDLTYLNQIYDPQDYLDDAAKTWQTCATRLKKDGLDLAEFNSLAMADDVAGVAQAFGHTSINLYGVSYGSLVAQHVARRHPELVATLLLDGVVAPQVNWTADVQESSNTSLQRIFDDCAADRKCAAAYPDLQNRYVRLVTQLNDAPLSLKLYDFNSETIRDARLTGDDFAGVIFQLSYSEDLVAYIPMFITVVERGDYTALQDFTGLLIFHDSTSEGVYASTVCSERSLASADEYQIPANPIIEITPQDIADAVRSSQDRCAAMDVPLIDDVYRTALSSDIPTLLISGRYDPITPAEYGEAARTLLTKSTHIVLHNTSHGGMLTNACAANIALAMMDHPDRKPDVTCVTEQRFTFTTPASFITTSLLYRGITGDESGLVQILIIATILLVAAGIWPIRITRALINTRNQHSAAPALRVHYAAQLFWGLVGAVLIGYLTYIAFDLFGDNFGAGSRFGIPLTYTGLRALVWLNYVSTLLLVVTWVYALRKRTQSVMSAGFSSLVIISGIVLSIILAQNGFLGW